jgi:hypothetical protein
LGNFRAAFRVTPARKSAPAALKNPVFYTKKLARPESGLKLNHMPIWKSGESKIPQNVTTLSISWLNNQFVARSIHRGRVEGTWEMAFAPDVEPDFAELLREAVAKTRYHGTTVSLLLTNTKLAQQLVEVPPVTGGDLIKVVQREAQQQQFFHGDAAWTFQTSLTVKDIKRVILHLLPKALLDQFIQAGRQNGLDLVSLVPVSAVLHQQLTLLPLNKGDVALLAAETGGCTTVVVGRADGQLLLVRTLLGNWNENAERLALDLKRTMSFITQQYDLNINTGVWMFGPGAEQQAPLLQRYLEHPVVVSPVDFQPDYWAIEATKLRPATTPNFIALELQKAPQRRRFALVAVAGTVVILLASIAAAVLLHLAAQQEAASDTVLRKHVRELQTERQDLVQRNSVIDGQQRLIKRLAEDRHPPVPAWLLTYLSEAIPTDLVVTSLHIKWDVDAWDLHLAGKLQVSAKPPTATALPTAVGLLADRLANGPFHLLILHRSDSPETLRGKTENPTTMETQFWIDGVMK